MKKNNSNDPARPISRRKFLKIALAAGGTGVVTALTAKHWLRNSKNATFIAHVNSYQDNLRKHILDGFSELGITSKEIFNKKILLKPNLVEPHLGVGHINTHPLMVQAAIEAFLHLGAGSVTVAEGSGHRRDSYLILEESGFSEIIGKDKVNFVDLNNAEVTTVKNLGKHTNLQNLVLPKIILQSDIVVSMPKMKTHHWVGATLAMKNLFGIMPGIYYGWPKNILHFQGIPESILDINTTVKPHLAIVDGIVGMEGDGPIMGTPVTANVIVMGRNLPAVDATCARIMGLNPYEISYMKMASENLGPINKNLIDQRGENIAAVHKDFKLLKKIPAHRGIRL